MAVSLGDIGGIPHFQTYPMLSNTTCEQANMDSDVMASSGPRPAACWGSNSQVPCGAVESDHGDDI